MAQPTEPPDDYMNEPLPRGTAAEYEEILARLYPGATIGLCIRLCKPHEAHEHSSGGEACRSPGKLPLGTGWNGNAIHRCEDFVERTDNAIAYRGHLARWLAEGGNIGWVIPPGLLVLDADSTSVVTFLKDRLWAVPRPTGEVFEYPNAESQPDHAHFVVRMPGILEGAVMAPSIGQASRYLPCGRLDLRVAGKGQIVVEPSTHATALQEYRWLVPLPEHLEDVPEIPGALLKAILDAPTKPNGGGIRVELDDNTPYYRAKSKGVPRGTPLLGHDVMPEGSRNELLFRKACAIRQRCEFPGELEASLQVLNLRLCRPPLLSPEVTAIATSAWRYERTEPLPGATDPDTPPAGTVQLFRRMSEIDPIPIDWLWRLHLPLGKFILVDGDPNTRKSTLMADWAAIVSTGRKWPDGESQDVAGGVVMVLGEDDPADTVVPRLMAANANLERVICLQPPAFGSFVADLGLLIEAVDSVVARLVILDPVMMFLGAVRDAHKDNEVRAALADLLAAARARHFCVVGIRHNRKSGGIAMHSGAGSIAWTAAARAVFQVTTEKDSDWSLLSITKANLAPQSVLMTSRRYRSVAVPGRLDQAIRIEYGDLIDLTADAALAQARAGEAKITAVEEAVEWLQAQLADGAVPSTTLKLRAKGYGIAWRTVERAREECAKTVKKDSGWYWELDE